MKKELIFDVKVNGSGAESEIEGVSDEVKGLGQEATKTTKETLKLSDALTKAKDELYELAREGKENTQEFKDLQAEASRLEGVMKSVDATISATAESGRGLSAALEIGSVVTAGYGAVQGTMALMGVESEKLMEMMVKLQAAQSILNALEQAKIALDSRSIVMIKAKAIATAVYTKAQAASALAIGGATLATRALNAAMLAMPVLAIVAGITALVMWMGKLAKENKSVEESNNKITKSYDAMTDAMERSARASEREHANKLALAKSEGATMQEVYEIEMAGLEQREVQRKKSLKLERETIDKRRVLYKQALENENYEEAKRIREQIEASRERYQTLKELDGQYFIDKKIAENNHQAELARIEAEGQKERLSQWRESQAKRKEEEEKAKQLKIEREKLMEDLIIQNIQDAEMRTRMQMILAHERERDDLKEKYGKDTELLKQLEAKQIAELDAFEQSLTDAQKEKEREKATRELELINEDAKARLAAKLINEQEDFEATMELRREQALMEFEIEMQNEALTFGQKELLHADFTQKLLDIDTEAEEQRAALREQNIQATLDGYNSLTASLGDLSSAAYESQLANVEKGSAAETAVRKKQFETNKKLQIAQAVMQGYQATLAAFSSGSAIPLVGAVMGPIFAGLATTASLAQINNIKKQKFDAGGGASVSTSRPSASLPTIPPNEYTNDGQTTEGLEGSGTPQPQQQQNIKVNIVDSEIKAKLDNSTKVEVLSSL